MELGIQKFSKSFLDYKNFWNPFHNTNEILKFSKQPDHIIRSLLHHLICLMTYTSMVWKQFQNWIPITKSFQNHFQIPNDFQNLFSFNMESGIFQNCYKWWIDLRDSMIFMKEAICLKKWPVKHVKWCNRLQVIWFIHFENSKISFGLRNWFQKIFVTPKWFWKFL